MKPFFTTNDFERIWLSQSAIHEAVKVANARVLPLQEENERLREALKAIASERDWGKDTALRRSITGLVEIARAALAEVEE